MKWIIGFTWEFPQALLGLVLFLFAGPWEKRNDNGVTVWYSERFHNGISLGPWILANKLWLLYSGYNRMMNLHERGHQIQSKIFGPLYLLVIGLPSIINAIRSTIMGGDPDYYKRYPEKWADELGSVDRK